MSLKDALINAAPDFLVKIFAAPYVAGDSEHAAAFLARELWSEKSLKSTVDLLGEELTRSEDVEATIESYQRVVDALGKQNFASISLKPTQLGSHESTDVCAENIARVARYANGARIPLTIDMEDHPYTDMTLEIYKRLLPEFPGLGTVLQTRLHRTEEDIRGLRGLKTRIRLCIGIYLEPSEIALTKKAQMKERVLIQGERLLDDGHYVEFGTHDERLIGRILDLATKRGFGKEQFEIQMLLGVPRENLQQQLVADGYGVRLYVPYAIEWRFATSYAKRRLASNPHMGLYVARNIVRQLFRR